MCKKPVSQCEPIEAEAEVEEDNDMSEDEAESTDSDKSSFTASSMDYSNDSDSDPESASGNPVTTDMVVLLMLKENGAITEAEYAARAEKCKYDIRSFIPVIPRSDSLDTIDYSKDLEDTDENCDGNEADAALKERLLQELVGENKGTEGSANVSMVTNCDNIVMVEAGRSQDVESSETVTDVRKCVSGKIDTDTSQDGVSKEKCKNENKDQQKEFLKLKKTESNEEDVTNLQQDQVLKVNQKVNNQQVIQEKIIFENMPSENYRDKTVPDEINIGNVEHVVLQFTSTENMVTKTENAETMPMEIDTEIRELEDDITEQKRENHLSENNMDIVTASIETNNNASQDVELTSKTEKESSEDQNTKREFNRPSGKMTKSFKYIVNNLIREKRISEEDDEDRIFDEYGRSYAEVLWSYVRELDNFYGPDMTASKMSVSDDEDDDDCYDGGLKEFALFLNFYSPSSYKYILETFNTPLPSHKVLCTWYLKDDHEPGLTGRAFKILKQKSSEKRLTCTLMFIDIFLKNHVRYYDQVDYGGGPIEDFAERAVLAYVFVLVSLDEDWKMPIGYIYARNVPAESQAELIRVCLTQCHDAGADVVAVTLETLTPAEFLGCNFQDPKNLKTTFKHPVSGRDVAVWIEPCLLLKSVRETLKVKGAIVDDRGNRVRWNLISNLRRLLKNKDGRDFEKPEFFELRNHIAKVRLTTEIFSESLAPALELSERLLPEMFTATEPTRQFILFTNFVYSILNSRVIGESSIPHTIIMHKLKAAKRYLLHIFCNEENGLSPFDRVNLAWGKERKGYRYMLRGEAACGFLGFLICIESFKHLHDTLIKKEKRITSLNPLRLCKVQAENFVSTLRAHACCDPEYFSASQFQDYYIKLFNALENNPQFTDKNVALEQWPLKDWYHPAVLINLTSGKRSYDDIYSSQYKLKKLKKSLYEINAAQLIREYSRALDIERDLSTRKNLVGFITGWIAAKFAKCLKCEACIDALCTNKKLWFHKLIALKCIYTLCLSSEELFRICWECELALRIKKTPDSLRAWVLRRLAPKFPWSSQKAEHSPGHHIQLTRAVIARYVALRIPVPFSSKDRMKIIDIFRLITSKDNLDE